MPLALFNYNISHKVCVRMDGTQFYDYDDLQPKITPPQTFQLAVYILTIFAASTAGKIH